jgi:predicted ATPase
VEQIEASISNLPRGIVHGRSETIGIRATSVLEEGRSERVWLPISNRNVSPCATVADRVRRTKDLPTVFPVFKWRRPMKCPACGFTGTGGMTVCGKCGTPLIDASLDCETAISAARAANGSGRQALGVSPVAYVEQGLTRFLGRESELELLLSSFEQCKSGKGQVFSIVGQAGIGKSRLLYEFRKALAGENVTFLEGNCHPHGKEMPYYPVIDILRSSFCIESGDKDSAIRAKVSRGLKALEVDEEWCLPYILELLSVANSGIENMAAGHEAIRDRILQSLKLIVLKGSEVRPVVLAVEDWQWTDKTSEEASEHLLRSIEAARVLIIFSYRPKVNNWSTIPYHTEVKLNGLSDRDALVMTADLLRTKKLDRDLKELVLQNTKGVPFFIEEFTGFLNNLKIVERKSDRCHLKRDIKEMRVPLTIQDVIMSRVNSLPASAKEVLLAGAAAGRQFDYQLIARVMALPDYELVSRLSILRYSGLLYERGTAPVSTYIFKHALIQDACYRSLNEGDCRQYHEKIARGLEDCSPETANERPESLAHHLTEAGLLDRAIPYWQKAAEVAVRRSANVEAAGHLKKALKLLARLPENSETARKEFDLQIALGPALMAIKGYADPDVQGAYAKARTLCRRLGDALAYFDVLRGLWGVYIMRAELQNALELGRQCLALAEHEQNPAFSLWGHQMVGQTATHLGDLTSAQEHFDRAISMYDVSKRRTQRALQDPGVACLSYNAVILWLLGYPQQALEATNKAVELARSLSHPFSLAYALGIGSLLCHLRRKTPETFEYAEEARHLGSGQGILYWSSVGGVLGAWALTEQGESREAIVRARRALSDYSATGSVLMRPYWLALLAGALAKEGKAEEAMQVLADAQAIVEASGERWCEAELHRLMGELLLLKSASNFVQAEACFERALDTAREQRARSFEMRTAISLSRLWKGTGKAKQGHKLLAKLYGSFTEGFDTPDLIDARILLDQLK